MREEPLPDTRPDWIKTNEVGSGEITYGDQTVPYTILKKELQPKLPGFLGYPKGEHLFISEEVPEEYRTPQLVHEIVEFTTLKGKRGRCVEALLHELAVVPEEIRQAYLEYRTRFFERLVAYSKDSENEEFKAEIKASYEYLQRIS